MASATELFDSGDGDTISDREIASVSRRFHVVVDAPTRGREDPADYVLRSTDLLDTAAVPIGTPHPSGYARDRAGLFSATYTVERRISYLNYIVRVDYKPPLVLNFDAYTPWTFSFSPGFGTKRASKITATHDPITGNPLSKPVDVNIGPRIYTENLEGDWKTTTTAGVKMWSPVGDERRIQGADVTYPIGTLTLSRQLIAYPGYVHSYLLSHRNEINNDHFIRRPPGTLKFVGPQVSSSQAFNDNGARTGMVFDVTLVFEDNDEGFFIEMQDTYTDSETGDEVPYVRASGNNAGETFITRFKYYNDWSFGSFLSTLEAFG